MESASSEEFPINNQLGLPGIYDEETELPNMEEDRRAGEQTENEDRPLTSPSSGTTTTAEPEVNPTTEKQSPISNPDTNALLIQLMQQMKEQTQKIQGQIQSSQQETITKTQEQIQKIQEQIQGVIEGQKQMREQLEQQVEKRLEEFTQTTNVKLQEQNTRIDNIAEAIKQNNKEIRKEQKAQKTQLTEHIQATEERVRGATEELRQEIAKGLKETSEQHTELKQTLKQNLREQRQRHEESVKEIREVVQGVNEKQQKMESDLRAVVQSTDKNREEVAGTLTQLRRQIESAEDRRTGTSSGPPNREQLIFQGSELYPMEFLSDMEETQRRYYDENDTRWIGQHLTHEAGTWWRLTRHQISSFNDFRELFVRKFWDETRQEGVRNDLEFGRFDFNNPQRTMVQYMEMKMLEARHLTPVIPTTQMIRKISRHYGREVQLATITRGIRNVTEFSLLLSEYENILGLQGQRPTLHESASGPQEHNKPYAHKNNWRNRQTDQDHKTHVKEGDRPRPHVASLEVCETAASTSQTGNGFRPNQQQAKKN